MYKQTMGRMVDVLKVEAACLRAAVVLTFLLGLASPGACTGSKPSSSSGARTRKSLPFARCAWLLHALLSVWIIACSRDGVPLCGECLIELDTVLTLRSSQTYDLALDAIVARSPRSGRFAVVPASESGVIALHGADGTYTGTIGRRGAGPYEYRRISSLFFSEGDSIVVFDSRNRRLDVYTPEGAPARNISLAGGAHTIRALGNGSTLAQGVVPASELAAFRVRIVTPDGAERGVAPYVSAYDAASFEYDRFPVVADSGGFWLANRFEYSFERHDGNGVPAGGFHVEAPWFEQLTLPDELVGVLDPRPLINDFSIDSKNRFWILGIAPRLPETLPDFSKATGPSQNLTDMFADHVLEVVDPEAAAVIATRTFPILPIYFLDGEYGYFADERSDDGSVVIRVVRFSLRES